MEETEIPRGNHRAVVRKLLETDSDMVLKILICHGFEPATERLSDDPFDHRTPRYKNVADDRLTRFKN